MRLCVCVTVCVWQCVFDCLSTFDNTVGVGLSVGHHGIHFLAVLCRLARCCKTRLSASSGFAVVARPANAVQ